MWHRYPHLPMRYGLDRTDWCCRSPILEDEGHRIGTRQRLPVEVRRTLGLGRRRTGRADGEHRDDHLQPCTRFHLAFVKAPAAPALRIDRDRRRPPTRPITSAIRRSGKMRDGPGGSDALKTNQRSCTLVPSAGNDGQTNRPPQRKSLGTATSLSVEACVGLVYSGQIITMVVTSPGWGWLSEFKPVIGCR